jgi:putative tryptophan/tyrosine transport system substrate-binding protein
MFLPCSAQVLDQGKQMCDKAGMRSSSFRSDNRKSKIQKRKLVGIVALAVILTMYGAVAQAQPKKVPRLGFLGTTSPSDISARVEAFRHGLREVGYVDGQNITIEYRWAEGKLDRLPNLAAELVSHKVDIIVTHGETAIRALKQVTKTIPIVVGVTGDLIVTGHAASLARPGGNITGLVDTSPELSGKRLELLKEILPKVLRIAVLWNGANPVKVLDFKETEMAAQALGLKLQSLEVKASEDFDNRFKAATTQHAGALVVLWDALTTANTRSIVEFAAKSRLPAMYGSIEAVDVGGHMAYAAKIPDLFRRAATYVDKILKGAKPGDLPVEQPTKFELVINLKTAKQIGLTIPPSVLGRADRVIR